MIVSLISWLVFAGVKDSMVYYITVDELLEDVPDIYGQKVRVSGTVVHGSIKNELDDSLRFTIAEGKGRIDIEYDGIIPDIFTDGVEAVVEGKFSTDNVFDGGFAACESVPLNTNLKKPLTREKKVNRCLILEV